MVNKVKGFFKSLLRIPYPLGLSAGAAEISPQWDEGNRCTPVLTFSGTTANCDAKVVAANSAAKINATMTLYRINANGSRTQVAAWTSLTGTGRLDVNRTHSPVVSGAKYHLVVSGTIAGKPFSAYQSKTCPQLPSTTIDLWAGS